MLHIKLESANLTCNLPNGHTGPDVQLWLVMFFHLLPLPIFVFRYTAKLQASSLILQFALYMFNMTSAHSFTTLACCPWNWNALHNTEDCCSINATCIAGCSWALVCHIYIDFNNYCCAESVSCFSNVNHYMRPYSCVNNDKILNQMSFNIRHMYLVMQLIDNVVFMEHIQIAIVLQIECLRKLIIYWRQSVDLIIMKEL